MTIFCIVIKGNDRHCKNYAWKNCDEQLCYQHRKFSDSFIKEELKKKNLVIFLIVKIFVLKKKK